MLLLRLWLALSTTLQAQPVPLFEAASVSLQALGPQAQQRHQVLQRLPMVAQLQLVRRWLGRVAAGWHREALDSAAWPAGHYVVVLRLGERTLTETLTRIR